MRLISPLFLLPLVLVYYRSEAKDTVHSRASRQLPPLSINSSVPYVFEARLYPFGVNQGDASLRGSKTDLTLSRALTFLGLRYDRLTIRRDGCLSLSSSSVIPSKKNSDDNPLVAPFCSDTHHSKVFYRETSDPAILQLAGNEVDIQYRYGATFAPLSVVIVTWTGPDTRVDNVFQAALIIGERLTFAHFVYSRLVTGLEPIAGFSAASFTYDLPGSATADAFKLTEKSDIGIPGEWLFRVDGSSILLCGPGFKGDECVDECANDEWGEDCARRCHCENGDACDSESGECPTGNCRKGWTSQPICDEDINECVVHGVCPMEQPDCMNTPGSFLCVCLAGDGQCAKSENPEGFPVKRIDISPQFSFSRSSSQRPSTTTTTATTTTTTEAHPMNRDEEILSFPIEFSSPSLNPFNLSSNEIEIKDQSPKIKDHHSEGTRRAPKTMNLSIGGKLCANCSAHATCLSSGCVCKPGWKGDGSLCLDVDECTEGGTGVSPCELPSVCANTRGSFVCLCPIGWEDRNGTCIDIDECKTKTHTCKKGEQCVNIRGSYSCECDEGYARNGTVCQEGVETALTSRSGSFTATGAATGATGAPAAGAGAAAGGTGTATGASTGTAGAASANEEGAVAYIDECSTLNAPCGVHALCTNTIGGYECECDRGFSRPNTESFCEDTDECTLMTPCHPAATCTNLVGTFHCACGEGFIGNGFDCHETILFPISNDSFILRRANNALATISLPSPVVLCGKEYGRVYLSSNCLISFDSGISLLSSPPDVLNETAILGLHAEYDYSKQGLVAYTYVNQSDPASFALLTRSSLSIMQLFRLQNIHTEHLHIFTFEDMLQKGTDRRNSFQIVLASSSVPSTTTFISLLYERASAASALAGISCPNEYHELPADSIGTLSNTGRPGHWLFSAATVPLAVCPAGATDPPLCQKDCPFGRWGLNCEGECHCEGGLPCDFPSGICASGNCEDGWTGKRCDEDIDECAANEHRCGGGHSMCVNTMGAFTCSCEHGYVMQDGACRAIERCLSRFGIPCHAQAMCQEIADQPMCICIAPLVGDGFECTTPPLSMEQTPPIIDQIDEATVNVVEEVAEVSTAPTTTKEIKIFGDRSRPSRPTTKKLTTVTTTTTTTVAPTIAGFDRATVVFFVGPSVLLGLWILLVLAIVFFCCNRRRHRRTAYDDIWGGPGPSTYSTRQIYT